MKLTLSNQRTGGIAALVLAASLVITACGSPAAPAAAESAAVPAAAAVAEVAMAAAPQLIAPEQYDAQFMQSGAGHLLVDVRTPEEYASGHIAGSVNIPVQELGNRLAEVSKDQPVVVYCRSGNRSAQAASILESAGYTGVYDLGGIGAWQQAGYPIE